MISEDLWGLPEPARAKLAGLIRERDERRRELDFARDAMRQLHADIAEAEGQLAERRRTEPRYEWSGPGHRISEILPPPKDQAAEDRLEARIATGQAELAQRAAVHAAREAEWRPLAQPSQGVPQPFHRNKRVLNLDHR